MILDDLQPYPHHHPSGRRHRSPASSTRPPATALRRWLERPALLATLVALGFGSVLAYFILAGSHVAPWAYVEGDVTTWIVLLRRGVDLHRLTPGLPMWDSNYPSLYLRLVAALAGRDESVLFVGRLVSLLGTLLGVLALAYSTGRATRRVMAGVLTGLLCLGCIRISAHAVLCYPDGLAWGVGACGVAFATLRTRGWPVLSGVLMGLSLCIKHSLIVFPMGVGLYLLVFHKNRQHLVVFMVSAGAILLTELGKPNAISLLVFASSSRWALKEFVLNFGMYILPTLFCLIPTAWVVTRYGSLPKAERAFVRLWLCVLSCGVIWIVALGRTAGGFNYTMELATASTVLAVVVFAHGRFRWALPLHAFVLLGESVGWGASIVFSILPARAAELRVAQEVLAPLPKDALIFAEPTYYATLSGHVPCVIPFLSYQLERHHLWNPQPLHDALRAGAVQKVLLRFPLEAETPYSFLSPSTYAALRANYRLDRQVGTLYIYDPVTKGALSRAPSTGTAH